MTYLSKVAVCEAVNDISPELFFPIPNSSNHEISLSGSVRNTKTGRILRTVICKSAARYYLRCSVGRIHRLLLSALLGRVLLRTELVQHQDGDTFNNIPSNLVLGTSKTNAIDKVLHNTNGRVLRNNQVREIRRLVGTRPRNDIAREFGITVGHVSAIAARRRWANLP